MNCTEGAALDIGLYDHPCAQSHSLLLQSCSAVMKHSEWQQVRCQVSSKFIIPV